MKKKEIEEYIKSKSITQGNYVAPTVQTNVDTGQSIQPVKTTVSMPSASQRQMLQTSNTKLDLPTYENEQKGNNAKYYGLAAKTGLVTGLTSIPQAPLQETEAALKRGEQIKTPLQAIGQLTKIGSLSAGMPNILSSTVNAIKTMKQIWEDKNRDTVSKILGSGVEALNSALDATGTSMTKYADAVFPLIGAADKGLDEKIAGAREIINKPAQNLQQEFAEQTALQSPTTQMIGQGIQAFTNMAPSMAATLATGNPDIGMMTMINNAKAQATQEALDKGATMDEAIKIGNAKAYVEYVTERISGGVNIFGKGAIDDVVNDAANKYVKNQILNFFTKQGIGIAGEVGEEIVSDVLGTLIDNGTLEPGKKYTLEDLKSTVGPTVISTILMNLVTGGYGGNAYRSNVAEMQEYNRQNGIQSPQENIAQTSEALNLGNNQYVENTQGSISKQMPSENQKIQAFRDSIAKEKVNDADGFYKAVEKVISDKDYNIVLDSSIKNSKGKPVNALISNDNGITIKINPKSERAGEILLMHEVTHGIETQEMSKLIMDYASKNSEFNDALEDLKKAYGTEDVTPEVVADISGQLFGNQEFINNLSVENPSIFKKIYDAIISVANRLTGNSKESLFVKDLQNKWERAYRESNIESAQQNLKEGARYSQNAEITDNKGRKLSKGQQERFRDSKARDEEGKLVTVYHTTSKKGKPFYEFNPASLKNPDYRYGDINVNFFSDDETMSGSYADGDYEKVDTSKNADTNKKAKWQYEGYLNIKNPYIVDAKGRMYHNAVVEFTKEAEDLFKKIEPYQNELSQLANESEKKFKESRQKGSYMYTKIGNKILENIGINQAYLDDIKNNSINDYQDFYNEAKKRNFNLPSPNEKIENLIEYQDEIDDLIQDYGDYRVEPYLNLTMEQFLKRFNDEKEEYKEESSWFEKKYREIIGDILDETGQSEEKEWYKKHVNTFTGKDWYNIAKENFSQDAKEKNAPWKYQYNTNDIVKYILRENMERLENEKYDGVIFKNIIDTADIENLAKYKPSTVYATFNSNQFKSVDNLNPTDDPDIRYSKNAQKWQEFLEKYFKNEGTTTNLKEKIGKKPNKKTETKQGVKLKENNGKYTREDVVKTAEQIRKQFDNQTLTNKKGMKVSNFYSNITEKSKFIEPETRETLKTEKSLKWYKEVTNEQALKEAVDRIGTTPSSQARALNEFLTKQEQFTAVDMAEGWVFLKQYQDAGNYDAMASVAKKMREMGTKSGQAIQMLNLEARLTPEGMYRFAVNELAEAEQKFNSEKGRTKKEIDKYRNNFQLTPEETNFIKTQMEKVQKMEPGRERDIEVAKINSMLQDKIPHTKGQSVKAWMRLSMLFNPKTQVRNVMGNALITPVNAFADVAAGLTDKYVAKKTGQRTIGGPSFRGAYEYVKRGTKAVGEAWQDYRMGIDTKNVNQNRFDIGQGKAFNEQHTGPLKDVRNYVAKKLNGLNDLLGFVMDAGDRFFLEGSTANSLYNQQRLNNTKEITKDMYDIAEMEGLQRTWNDNNQFTKAVLNIRRAINDIGGLMHIKIGEYGLGDLMIPFAKTPANLTKAIVDYSPVGFLNAITEGKDLKRAIETGNYTPQQQHDFAQTVGKATAGSILYALGIALAQMKITSGDSDEDKDLKNFMRYNLGIQPYSIKVGNKSFTYDWAQPIAAPLAITADIEKGINENMTPPQAIQQFLTTGFNILTEQSFLSGINEVLNDNDGLLHGIEQQVINMPATAIPTLLKQYTDMVDSTKRQTYSKEGMVENAKKYAQSKRPSKSKNLAPQVDVLGNEIQKYGGENNIFNVFFNPANTEKGKSSEVSEEIYSLYQETGNKNIIPKKVDYSITINGKKKILTTDEMAKWQKASGKYVTSNIEKAIQNSKYQRMSSEDKASVINGIVNYSYMKAKSETFGMPISSYYSGPSKAEQKGIPMYDYYISKVKE